MSDLSTILATITKKWGEDALLRFADMPKQSVEAISSGCLAIDAATQIGGYPRGAITELFGPECIYAGSFIQYEVHTRDGRRQNHEGGTIERLYERFNRIQSRKRPQTVDSWFSVPSIDEHDRVFQNKVTGVVKCGSRECFRITTRSGHSLVATPEHKFYTDNGYVELGELRVGDNVFVRDDTHPVRYVITPSVITSIDYAGELDTYDISCLHPHNNYIADGIVVHNSGGKTSLALWFLAHVQKTGGTAAFINTEQKGDPRYIRSCIEAYGGCPDDILVSMPSCGEEALDIVERLIDVVDAVVLDSVADLVTQAELDADDARANFVGMQARLITKALKRIKPKLGLSSTALLFTNQVRANIGGYGSSETTGGGKALRHAETLRLRVSVDGRAIKRGGVEIGVPCKAKVRKNQVGKPGQTAKFDIVWGEGIDLVKDTFEAAKITGVIDMQPGGYYVYDNWPDGDERLRGEEAVKNVLRASPDLMEEIRSTARERLRGQDDD